MKTTVTAREIYIWNMLGNLAASGIAVFYLLSVTRLTSTQMADDFSLAVSIGWLWVIIGLFQVRNYHGTDVMQTHSFAAYCQTRMVTIGVMLVTILPYLLLGGSYSRELIVLVVFTVCYRAWDAVSDLFQGLFQQRERMDIAGKVMFYRYCSSALVFFVILFFSRSVIATVGVLAVWNGLYTFAYEMRFIYYFERVSWRKVLTVFCWREIAQILRACWPLFVNGFLLLCVLNEPKLVIAKGMGLGILPIGTQRDFNILFMPVFFASLCVLIVRPLMTQLALIWNNGDYRKFSSVARKIILSLFAGGMLVTLIAYLVGVQILGAVFGTDLSAYSREFGVLIFAGTLYAVTIVYENLVTVLRQQHLLLGVYFMIFVVSKLATEFLIMRAGMTGAALSFLLVVVVYMVAMAGVYMVSRRRAEREACPHAPALS